MRGFTLNDIGPNGEDNYIDSDFSDLAATKADLVRIPLPLRRTCDTCSSYNFPSAEVATVEDILKKGQYYGFRAVVTLEIKSVPGEGAVREYWNEISLQKSIADNWAKIATQLKTYPALAAYDLINEPVPPGGLSAQRSAWGNFATTLINAIRAVDPSHVIVFEPAPWALPASFQNLQHLPIQNIVYSLHFYNPHKFTHQGVYPDTPYGVNYPNAQFNAATMSQVLQPVRDFVNRTGAPIYVGEFSAARWAPDNSASQYLSDAIKLFEAEKWSWTYLGWRGYHGWDAEIPYTEPRDLKAAVAAKRRVAHTSSIDVIRSYLYNDKLP